jgi:hypothetical protein
VYTKKAFGRQGFSQSFHGKQGGTGLLPSVYFHIILCPSIYRMLSNWSWWFDTLIWPSYTGVYCHWILCSTMPQVMQFISPGDGFQETIKGTGFIR